MIWEKLFKQSVPDQTSHGLLVCIQCAKEYGADKKSCPDDGGLLVAKTDKPPVDNLLEKVFVDRYYMLSVLGEGGMSVVYKAHHTMMDRPVAIKILKNFESSQDKMLKRFQQEARAASSLNHPNLITLHDFGITTDGQAYIVMDYLEGQNLDAVIERQGYIGFERAAKIFLQICDGLDHAHSKGIIHRDIKPSNILVLNPNTPEESVKIVDFGIAKLLPESNKETFHLTQAGQIFGSPLFMSPEQCANKKVDSRTDIYAVGATLFTALVGSPPFEAPTLAEIIYSHLKEKPASPNKANPKNPLPPRFEQLVLRCLEKNPDDRFPSMADLKAEIQVACGSKKDTAQVRKTLINVVVAEDSDELANNIIESLAVSGGLAVIGRAKSGEEALDKVMQYLPQVVLIDIRMPGLDGVQVTKQLKACSPNIRVLLYSVGEDFHPLIQTLNAGADGYIFQDLSPGRLGPAVKAIVNGIPWIDPEITSRVLRQSAHSLSKSAMDTSTKAASNQRLDHANYLEDLAQIYVNEKKYDEAEALYHGAIALHEKSRGKDCPELTPSLTKLADLYMSRQKAAAAEQMYLRALQIRFQSLGQEHLDVAASLESLALLFQISGGFAESERFYIWALRIRQKLGDRSMASLEALSSTFRKVSLLYRCMNRPTEAADMERLALNLQEDTLSITRSSIPD